MPLNCRFVQLLVPYSSLACTAALEAVRKRRQFSVCLCLSQGLVVFAAIVMSQQVFFDYPRMNLSFHPALSECEEKLKSPWKP